jgi:hypothetical protein
MTLFRIKALESLGFDWKPSIGRGKGTPNRPSLDEWGVFHTTWEDRLGELADYRKIHGHCNVPQNYTENAKLANWGKFYSLHVRGKASSMTTFRIQELESLGFEWRVCTGADCWEDHLSELAAYRKIHGHFNVPRSYSENSKLYKWVSKQRYQYMLHIKGKISQMSLPRIQAWENLRLEWKSSVSRGRGRPKKPSIDCNATRVRKRVVEAPEHMQTTAHTQEYISAREIRRNQVDVGFDPEESGWNGEFHLAYVPGRTEEI